MSRHRAVATGAFIGCVVVAAVALAASPAPTGGERVRPTAATAGPARVEDEALPEAPLNPYVPPACAGLFSDVACPGGFAVNWIENFYNDGITAGCGTNPLKYCPDATVTRAQMAVFVEKAVRGTGTWSPGDLSNGNTGLGRAALLNNSVYAMNNTAVGNGALQLQSFTNGNANYYAENTAVGWVALYNNQPDGGNGGFNGTQNTAVGVGALGLNTVGYFNTSMGEYSGHANVSGYGNTFLGRGADVDSGGRVNATAIGWGAIVDDSYKVQIGNTDVTAIGGQVAWTAFSDIRGKKDVADLDLGLDFVLALRPVSYRLKSGNDRIDMGFVAQDIEALLGDGYNVLTIGGDKDRTLALRHTDLIAPIVKAIQEQQATIEAQQGRLATQDRQIGDLLARVAKLEAARQR